MVGHVKNRTLPPKPSQVAEEDVRDYLAHKENYRAGLTVPARSFARFVVVQCWLKIGIPKRVQQGAYVSHCFGVRR
jgi:hypothetical protein